MVICKDGNFAFTGANVDEAYKAYLNSDCDHSQSGPDGLEWFIASRADLTMNLVQKPASSTTKQPATKRKAQPRDHRRAASGGSDVRRLIARAIRPPSWPAQKELTVSGAMQRITEAAEAADLDQKPTITPVDDRLIVISYPGCLDDEIRDRIREEFQHYVNDLGYKAIVVDRGTEIYRPSLIGPVSLQLSSLESQVAALSEMVKRLVEFVEAGEQEEPDAITLDGDPAGKARDPGDPL